MQLGPLGPSQSQNVGTLNFLFSQFRSFGISPVGFIDGTPLQKDASLAAVMNPKHGNCAIYFGKNVNCKCLSP